MENVHFVNDPKLMTTHFNDDGKLVPNVGIKCFLPDGAMIRGSTKQRKLMREKYPDMPSLRSITLAKKNRKPDQDKNMNKNIKQSIKIVTPKVIKEPKSKKEFKLLYTPDKRIKKWQLDIIIDIFMQSGRKKMKLDNKWLFRPYFQKKSLKRSLYKNGLDCFLHEESKAIIRACSYLKMIYKGTYLYNLTLPDFINNDILEDCFFEKAKSELLLCKKNEKKIRLFVWKCLFNYNKIINSKNDPLLPLKDKWPVNVVSFFLDYSYYTDLAVPWLLLFYYRPQPPILIKKK